MIELREIVEDQVIPKKRRLRRCFKIIIKKLEETDHTLDLIDEESSVEICAINRQLDECYEQLMELTNEFEQHEKELETHDEEVNVKMSLLGKKSAERDEMKVLMNQIQQEKYEFDEEVKAQELLKNEIEDMKREISVLERENTVKAEKLRKATEDCDRRAKMNKQLQQEVSSKQTLWRTCSVVGFRDFEKIEKKTDTTNFNEYNKLKIDISNIQGDKEIIQHDLNKARDYHDGKLPELEKLKSENAEMEEKLKHSSSEIESARQEEKKIKKQIQKKVKAANKADHEVFKENQKLMSQLTIIKSEIESKKKKADQKMKELKDSINDLKLKSFSRQFSTSRLNFTEPNFKTNSSSTQQDAVNMTINIPNYVVQKDLKSDIVYDADFETDLESIVSYSPITIRMIINFSFFYRSQKFIFLLILILT